MRLRGRLWLVLVVVCLTFLPVRSEAATIIPISGTLSQADDIVFVPFTITEESSLSLDVTGAFVPLITLFGPVTDPQGEQLLVFPDPPIDPANPTTYQWITEFSAVGSDSIMVTGPDAWKLPGTISGTSYVLALSQDPNRFEPSLPGGWAADLDPVFFRETLAAFCVVECTGNEQFVNASGAPGTGEFTGRFEVAPTSVPEPATLSLLAIGGAALTARRRRKRDES